MTACTPVDRDDVPDREPVARPKPAPKPEPQPEPQPQPKPQPSPDPEGCFSSPVVTPLDFSPNGSTTADVNADAVLDYVTFRDAQGGWSELIHLGPPVSSASALEYAASLSPDGRFLFFMSARGEFKQREIDPPLTRETLDEALARPGNGNPAVWWIDASFIDALAP